MQLLAEDELEDHRADAHRRQIRDNDGRDQIQRSDNRAQQHDQGQKHHEQCHRDDEPDVVLVVVAGVLQSRRCIPPSISWRPTMWCSVALPWRSRGSSSLDPWHRC